MQCGAGVLFIELVLVVGLILVVEGVIDLSVVLAGEPVGVDMRFEMMNGIEGFVPENGEGAGSKRANQKRAEKTGSVSNSNIINIIFGEVGIVEGFVNDREDSLEMRTGGNLGNYTAIGSENVNLRNDDIADDSGVVAYDGGGGFVAGTLDGKNFHMLYIVACFGG